jgi:hypothetical protein
MCRMKCLDTYQKIIFQKNISVDNMAQKHKIKKRNINVHNNPLSKARVLLGNRKSIETLG